MNSEIFFLLTKDRNLHFYTKKYFDNFSFLFLDEKLSLGRKKNTT